MNERFPVRGKKLSGFLPRPYTRRFTYFLLNTHTLRKELMKPLVSHTCLLIAQVCFQKKKYVFYCLGT